MGEATIRHGEGDILNPVEAKDFGRGVKSDKEEAQGHLSEHFCVGCLFGDV